MFESLPKQTFSEFRGYYNRGDINSVPPTHAISAVNCQFGKNSFKHRRGLGSVLKEWTGLSKTATCAYEYFDTGVFGAGPLIQRFLVGVVDGPNGKIFRVQDLQGGFNTPLLTLAGWDGRFCAVTNGDRIFIMPYTTNDNLYVYQIAANNLRVALGASPVAAPGVGAGAAGNVEAGDHLFAYAFETDTGFITKPGPAIKFTAAGAQQANLNAVAVGPAGTVARHILMTKKITGFTGDLNAYEYFFAGKINDNVTTVISINKFDTELVDSADYLFDQLSVVQSARGIFIYDQRLVVFGFRNGRDGKGTAIVSRKNEMESFDGVDGNIILPQYSDAGVYGGFEYRGVCYICTPYTTYGFQADDTDVASNWPVTKIDDIGIACTEVNPATNLAEIPSFAVAHYRGKHGIGIDDVILINTNSGLRVFNGSFGDNLTHNIEYDNENATALKKYDHLVINPDSKELIMWVGDNGPLGPIALYADWKDGLSSETIRWSPWTVGTASMLKYDGVNYFFQFIPDSVGYGFLLATCNWILAQQELQGVDGATIGGVDRKSSIVFNYSLPLVRFQDGWIHHYVGAQILARNLQSAYDSKFYTSQQDWNGNFASFGPNWPVTWSAANEVKIPMNIVQEALSFQINMLNLTVDAAHPNMRIEVSRIDVHGYPLWMERPR